MCFPAKIDMLTNIRSLCRYHIQCNMQEKSMRVILYILNVFDIAIHMHIPIFNNLKSEEN